MTNPLGTGILFSQDSGGSEKMASDESLMSAISSSTLREIANLALWFVPEGAQSAWTLLETHRNSTSYDRDDTRTSELLIDRQTPYAVVQLPDFFESADYFEPINRKSGNVNTKIANLSPRISEI